MIAANKSWQWQPYTGPDPHTGHLYLSVVATPLCDDPQLWNMPLCTGASEGTDGDGGTTGNFTTWGIGVKVRNGLQMVKQAKVSVSTIGGWERGTAIPGRRDGEALEQAYGFGEGEFARPLDFTGPPERRGAPGVESRRPAGAAADTPFQRPPGCDCDVQARRGTMVAPRLSAVPVWHDEITRPKAGSGVWFLDRGQDASATLTLRRTRFSPTIAASGTDGVLGPIGLAARMHRGDWPQYLIGMSAAITRYAAPHVAAHRAP